jgi:hypothetical protein
MQSKALSAGASFKKLQVIRALFCIRAFSTSISFGVPVDPEVRTFTKGEALCHSARNSCRVIDYCLLKREKVKGHPYGHPLTMTFISD